MKLVNELVLFCSIASVEEAIDEIQLKNMFIKDFFHRMEPLLHIDNVELNPYMYIMIKWRKNTFQKKRSVSEINPSSDTLDKIVYCFNYSPQRVIWKSLS